MECFDFPSNVKQPIKFSANQRPCLTKCVLKVENDKIQPDLERTHTYQPFDVLPRLLLNLNHVIPTCCTRIKWGIHSEVTGKVPRYLTHTSVRWCVNRNNTSEVYIDKHTHTHTHINHTSYFLIDLWNVFIECMSVIL